MNVKSPRAIRTAAQESLAQQNDHRKVPLVYGAFSALLSLAVNIIADILTLRIDQMTGLSNMGTRAVLSTVKSTLPVAMFFFLMIWELCYQNCALGFARRRTITPRNMKESFVLFGPMLRSKILMGVVYVGLGIGSMYLGSFIFMTLPISRAFLEIMLPLMESVTVLNPAILIDEATARAILATGWPSLAISGAVFLVVSLPVFYGFRMVNFCICDHGHRGALAAIKESRAMTKGHRMDLFKLDLSFWWFFLMEGGISVLGYLDVILAQMGFTLPWSNVVSYYLFLILSLACQVALYWAYLNRVTVARAVIYDAIRPQESAGGGVTLGNIFELAKDYKEE